MTNVIFSHNHKTMMYVLGYKNWCFIYRVINQDKLTSPSYIRTANSVQKMNGPRHLHNYRRENLKYHIKEFSSRCDTVVLNSNRHQCGQREAIQHYVPYVTSVPSPFVRVCFQMVEGGGPPPPGKSGPLETMTTSPVAPWDT